MICPVLTFIITFSTWVLERGFDSGGEPWILRSWVPFTWGKGYDAEAGQLQDELLMYDARDLTNLLLAFPELRPEDFRPWINPDGGELFGPRRVFPHCSDHEGSSHIQGGTRNVGAWSV